MFDNRPLPQEDRLLEVIFLSLSVCVYECMALSPLKHAPHRAFAEVGSLSVPLLKALQRC